MGERDKEQSILNVAMSLRTSNSARAKAQLKDDDGSWHTAIDRGGIGCACTRGLRVHQDHIRSSIKRSQAGEVGRGLRLNKKARLSL
jgi:hypothetical protein